MRIRYTESSGKKYGMTQGGRMNKKPPTIKKAPALSKPRKPKKMAKGKKLVARKTNSYAKGGSGCGCGGSMKTGGNGMKTQSYQQGGVVANSGNNLDPDEFSKYQYSLFPNGIMAMMSSAGLKKSNKTSSAIPTSSPDNNPDTIPSMNPGIAKDAQGLLDDLKKRRKDIGLNTSAPTSPISSENIFQYGSAKKQGSSTQMNSTNQRVFADGGSIAVIGDGSDGEIPDNTVPVQEKDKFKLETSQWHRGGNQPAMTPVEDETSTRLGYSVRKYNDPGAFERIFNAVDSGKDFDRLVNFIHQVGEAESFSGRQQTNPNSSAKGYFHLLTNDGGRYNKDGSMPKDGSRGGYDADGERKYSSFETAKNRLKNMMVSMSGDLLDSDSAVNDMYYHIKNTNDPRNLTKEEQALLVYANLKMRKGDDMNRFLDGDDAGGLNMYKKYWVTDSDPSTTEAMIDRNWKNAETRLNKAGGIDGRKFLEIPSASVNKYRKAYESMSQWFKAGGKVSAGVESVRKQSMLIP